MNLLNRYIFSQFMKNILMIMAGFISIYMLIDFFEKIDNFNEAHKPMGLVVKFFLMNIPFILDQLGPICILLAGIVTLGLLNHNNELIALKASGIPLTKIVAPILGGGVFFTLLFLLMAQFVLPRTISVTNRIWNEEVRNMVPLGIYRNGRYYYRGGDGFYSFARPDPNKNIFVNFSYSDWNEEKNLSRLVHAKLAEWKNNQWGLHYGQIQELGEDGDYTTRIFKHKIFSFAEEPKNFFVPEYYSRELSLVGLYQEVQRSRDPESRVKSLAEFYGRFSYILLGLPLLIIGLPLLLVSYRRWGRDLSVAIPASCGLAFGCWGIWGALQSLAKAGYIHPLPAAFTMHLLIGLSGAFLLWRENR